MITVIPVGGWGITLGVRSLKNRIKEHSDQFIDVMCVERSCKDAENTLEFTFIALFKEKGTLGQYVAFISEWGTNYGDHAGGEGSRGFEEFNEYLDQLAADTSREFVFHEWDSIPVDYRAVLDDEKSLNYERMQVWGKIVMNCMFPVL